MKYLYILLLTLLYTSLVNAQTTIQITGKVLETNNKQPIAFATVIIADTITNKAISGTTTLDDGSFLLKTNRSDFYIEISFMGFSTRTFKTYKVTNGLIDLGKIFLSENAEALDEIVVQGEVSKTIFKLDKRVFNVGSDIASTGVSGLEVLNNVPSVNVNIEGEISLRGNTGVQILINGKPSAMASDQGNALGTLTSEMIEKIEVITNPSAKYDAEGTSGIINIILKKESRKGINGAITLNTGTPDNHSIGFSLNKRTEKFNLFSQLGFGYRSIPKLREVENRDLTTNESVLSKGISYLNETFYNIILGTDYHINEYNVITLSGHYAYEIEKLPYNNRFTILDADDEIVNIYDRIERANATNPKYRYELQYKKDFKRHKEQTLMFSALGDLFHKDKTTEFYDVIIIGDDQNNPQKSQSDFKIAEHTFKIDYTHPFNEKINFETGVQYVMNDVSNDFAVDDFVDDLWIKNTDLTNVFDYNQNVLGIYSTLSYERDRWGLKLGVRMENTDLKTLLINTAETHQQQFTDFFPSGHTSYKFDDNFSLQLGYSKRIARPDLWNLNPFYSVTNNYDVFIGNSSLRPEYTDSYELNSIHKFGKLSLNWALFHKKTTDVIEDVTTFNENVSATTPENIGTNKSTGVELNFKYRVFKWLTLNNDTNYNYYKRQGDFNDTSFDFKANFWLSKLTSKFNLPANFDMEITTRYSSKYKSFQKEHLDNFYVDFDLRKKIIKGKVVLNLSIQDVFESKRDAYISDQTDFYLFNSRKQGRFIVFGVSYGFGKGEAMQFSGQKMF